MLVNIKLFFIFLFLLVKCANKNVAEKEKPLLDIISVTDSINTTQSKIDDSNTIDSLNIGTIFYNNDAFKNYKFIETEPYEFVELNDTGLASQIMIYLKSNNYYAILVSAETNIEKSDSGWKKSKKTIVDLISFDINFELCWYIYDGNFPPLGRFGIGTEINKTLEINEYSNCEIYKKYKVFDVDYEKGKFEEVNKKDAIFCCSDGY